MEAGGSCCTEGVPLHNYNLMKLAVEEGSPGYGFSNR